MPEIKQYVNLEADSSDTSRGRKKNLKIQMENKIATPVFIFLESDPGNKDKSKLKMENRAGIDASNIEKTMTISGIDSSINFELVLSNYGGDKFKVKASTDPQGKTDVKEITDTYVVWKKLYYQLSSMKPSYNFSLSNVTDEYKKHYIELEETNSIIVPHKENLETADLKTYRQYFKKQQSPLEVHIALIDRQCDSEIKRFKQKIALTKELIPYSEDAWPFSDFLVTALCKIGNETYKPGGIKVTQVANGIEVSITDPIIDPSKVDVYIDVSIKVLQGEYTGDASYPPHVFIAVGKPRSDSSKSKTVAHEIGHGIGMVPKTGHSLHYENQNGGMGDHCRYGADQNENSAAQGGTFKGTYTNGTCVMFAFSSEHYKFCETCKEFVRESLLYRDNMKARKWG